MRIGAIVSRAQKAAADNTPTILTVIGVTGTVATAVLAAKGAFKADEILRREAGDRIFHEGELQPLEVKEKVEKTWQCFVPAAISGIATVTCIVAANRVSSHRAEALASAYLISQKAAQEYKNKVLEKLGEKKEREIRDEITQKHVNENPPSMALIVASDNVLCLDAHSGRYFTSDMVTIGKAVNDTNFQILNNDYASLTDFWDRIGLQKTSESDEVGWNTDKGLEVEYSGAITPDGKPCIAVEFRTLPLRGFYKQKY
jgi:hypothetical protein